MPDTVPIPGGGEGIKITDQITLPIIKVAPPLAQRQRCNNCAFWQGTNSTSTTGKCRVNSPTIAVGGTDTLASWPTTAKEDVCGQHSTQHEKLPEGRCVGNSIAIAGGTSEPSENQFRGHFNGLLPSQVRQEEITRLRSFIDGRLWSMTYNIVATAACGMCEWFDDSDNTCHHQAPIPNVLETLTPQNAIWPIVDINDFCSKFKPNMEAAQALMDTNFDTGVWGLGAPVNTTPSDNLDA